MSKNSGEPCSRKLARYFSEWNFKTIEALRHMSWIHFYFLVCFIVLLLLLFFFITLLTWFFLSCEQSCYKLKKSSSSLKNNFFTRCIWCSKNCRPLVFLFIRESSKLNSDGNCCYQNIFFKVYPTYFWKDVKVYMAIVCNCRAILVTVKLMKCTSRCRNQPELDRGRNLDSACARWFLWFS